MNQKLIRKTYNLCYRLTGDEVLAQDFCIKVFTGTQNNSQSIPTDFLHAAKTTVGMLWDSESSKQPRQSELIDSKREIQRALNALPIKERMAVVLKDVLKLTYVEIEEIIPNKDVYRLVNNGRRKITHTLKHSRK